MAINPNLSNTEMVRAILDGRKTKTRRLVKDGSEIAPVEPGDILWVRETWCNLPVSPGGHARLMRGRYYYKADVPDIRPEGWRGNWKPSIHMPKEAARIFLKVTDVRMERLRKITARECEYEGIEIKSLDMENSCGMEKVISIYNEITDKFGKLWDSTISKDQLCTKGWEANPLVWVYTFERCEKPEGF